MTTAMSELEIFFCCQCQGREYLSQLCDACLECEHQRCIRCTTETICKSRAQDSLACGASSAKGKLPFDPDALDGHTHSRAGLVKTNKANADLVHPAQLHLIGDEVASLDAGLALHATQTDPYQHFQSQDVLDRSCALFQESLFHTEGFIPTIRPSLLVLDSESLIEDGSRKQLISLAQLAASDDPVPIIRPTSPAKNISCSSTVFDPGGGAGKVPGNVFEEEIEDADPCNVNPGSTNSVLNFACPYMKHDPSGKLCRQQGSGRGWPTVPRLKSDHLYTRHILYQCRQCSREFVNPRGLKEHTEDKRGCTPRPFKRGQGIDGALLKELRCRKKPRSNMTPAEQWIHLYRTLFPEADPENIPSPYYDATEIEPQGGPIAIAANDIQVDLSTQFTRLVAMSVEILPEHLKQEWQGIEPKILELLEFKPILYHPPREVMKIESETRRARFSGTPYVSKGRSGSKQARDETLVRTESCCRVSEQNEKVVPEEHDAVFCAEWSTSSIFPNNTLPLMLNPSHAWPDILQPDFSDPSPTPEVSQARVPYGELLEPANYEFTCQWFQGHLDGPNVFDPGNQGDRTGWELDLNAAFQLSSHATNAPQGFDTKLIANGFAMPGVEWNGEGDLTFASSFTAGHNVNVDVPLLNYPWVGNDFGSAALDLSSSFEMQG